MSRAPVALVHDYLTQRGGAERVVLTLAEAYPAATVHTSLYDPDGTFAGFGAHRITTLPLDRIALLRAHHRLALPLLAPAFSRLTVDAEVALCSSSGWAHGCRATGRKVVYCHTPARWLYQTDRYLQGSSRLASAALSVASPALRRWDRRAAATADRYLVNSRVVRDRVADIYGLDAEVLPPPIGFGPEGEREPVDGIEPGCYLCVSRLLPYKNVDAVVEAFRRLPGERLVVVGSGPTAEQLAASAPPNVTLVGTVGDAGLRWLYAAAAGLIAASYEDFGMTPVEAAAFGKPTAALRWGGFLDTIVEGTTGVFFDEPTPGAVAGAVGQLAATHWDAGVLAGHVRGFAVERFVARIAEIVDEERSRA